MALTNSVSDIASVAHHPAVFFTQSGTGSLDFDEFDDVALNAHSLGGIYPLSVESVEEDPFSSDFTTSNTDMTLLFRVCDEDGDFESDECPIEDFEKYKEGWKELLHDLEK